MPKFIKSHSNYRLSTRHQTVNNGEILERDISTVGGANTFATGQATMYQSGNFVIVVNNDSHASRHVVRKGWLSNTLSGETWTAEVLKEQTSDVNGSVEDSILIRNDFTDFRSFACFGSLYDLVRNTISGMLRDFPYEIYTRVSDKWAQEPATFEKTRIVYEISNPGAIDIYTSGYNTASEKPDLRHFCNDGYKYYSAFIDGQDNPDDGHDITWSVSYTGNYDCPTPNTHFATAAIGIDGYGSINILVYWDEKLQVRYAVDDATYHTSPIHIRPRLSMSFYDDFVDGLDLFGKCLMGVYSGRKLVSMFQVINDVDSGNDRSVETFVFPTGAGGYNLGSDGMDMQDFVQRLSRIGLRYDEKYTDNAFRMMTHDSMKNLDWTNGFNGEPNDSEENQYIRTGEKLKAVIRVMGYVFDNEMAYAESISNSSTIAYGNHASLPDYFLTDSLETDGWFVNTIYPYELTEYDENGNVVLSYVQQEQIENMYRRHFGENVTEIMRPYDETEYEGGRMGYIEDCEGGKAVTIQIPYDGNEYYVENGSGGTLNILGGFDKGFDDSYDIDRTITISPTSKVATIARNYSNDTEVTVPEVNNEFMKRLRINSKQLFRKKGTIDGVESILSLFGMVSESWYDEMLKRPYEIGNGLFGTKGIIPDFTIKEYTVFTPPFEETWDVSHNSYKVDWYNSCKTIAYPTMSYVNGVYIPYQGLPVSYKDIEGTVLGVDQYGNEMPRRKLYPGFSSKGIYDGGMYYQMNGGWLNYMKYFFDTNDDMVYNPGAQVHHETLRNVLQVKDIMELVSQQPEEVLPNVVYYVNDVKKVYAVINGQVYNLTREKRNGYNDTFFLETYIYGGTISLGGELFEGTLTVSDPYGTGGYSMYEMPLYNDGTPVRIYYTGDRNNPFSVMSDKGDGSGQHTPDLVQMFSGGTVESVADEYSQYFMIPEYGDTSLIGEYGWEQIRYDDDIYKKINGVVDDFTGNNPHSGNYAYDNGHEYLKRYKRLFGYALDNDYFMDSCFTNKGDAYSEMESMGFQDIVGEDNYYWQYLHEDRKVHAFVDRMDFDGSVTEYDSDDSSSLSALKDYSFVSSIGDADGETAQIVNTKVVDLIFYLKAPGDMFSKEAQEEVKYIQCKVMPYVEQMIPSNVIMNVMYSKYGSTLRLGDFNIDYNEDYFID